MPSHPRCVPVFSVMSGVITGPHFRKYFNDPTAIEVGTMVAVLEIGAFSEFTRSVLDHHFSRSSDRVCSHFRGCWTSWRHHRETRNALQRCCRLCSRWRHTDLHLRFLDYGHWPYHLWPRRWLAFVSVLFRGSCIMFIPFHRTIVPIYQSEISPPDHVCDLIAMRLVTVLIPVSVAWGSRMYGVHRQHFRLRVLCGT